MYVNYGRESDFKYLESIDITCLGRVVILRHGKIHGIQKVNLCESINKCLVNRTHSEKC